jgi:hypothetical protein
LQKLDEVLPNFWSRGSMKPRSMQSTPFCTSEGGNGHPACISGHLGVGHEIQA